MLNFIYDITINDFFYFFILFGGLASLYLIHLILKSIIKKIRKVPTIDISPDSSMIECDNENYVNLENKNLILKDKLYKNF